MIQIALHVDQTRDESRLGASEAPAVLGLDRYASPMTIWRRHRGMQPIDRPTEAAEWGVTLEPVIRGKYALKTGSRVLVPSFSMTFDDWLRCTPDGIVFLHAFQPSVEELMPSEWTDGLKSLANGLVQCKNVDAHLAYEWSSGPPPRAEVQARVELAVTGLPWCDLVALIGGNRYVQHRVERDLVIEARILRDLRAFWALVQAGVEPAIDHSDAWKVHAGEKMRAEKMVAEATGEDVAAMLALKARLAERKAAVAAEKLARNEVLLRLAQRAVTALRSEDPSIGTVSAYRTRGTWALRCPPQWGDDE